MSEAEINRRSKQKNGYGPKDRYYRAWKSVACTDCSESFGWWAMSADHTRGEKLFDLNLVKSGGKITMEELQAELDKCDPVCLNCHATREHNRDLEESS